MYWREIKRRAAIFVVCLFVLLWCLALFLGTTEMFEVGWELIWVSSGLCVLVSGITATKV